jgi:hypothetical protein
LPYSILDCRDLISKSAKPKHKKYVDRYHMIALVIKSIELPHKTGHAASESIEKKNRLQNLGDCQCQFEKEHW